ncbi:MAG: transcription antitermination factor NusB [Candidatus Coatesbacteria bacterium RBG_13_66_14]|uniref:Transcription antitermination protein NusB n=1 Tax=Candidatus Coatesbacteria bacterium RBG_13_66_14 TaxID=1817816 RepID=A0A1F5EWJ9_9BACT|nr:MAG: transcription antitermination factor NusB [Candidatus Coatesbacteria bacterium RBG_13_66_14]
MTRRRLARESALQMLYQAELAGADGVRESYWSTRFPHPEVVEFADRLVERYFADPERIDGLVRENLENYRLERLGHIERALLRAALAEMLEGETPARVVIDEAVEIGRDYAGEEAVAIVNAVLDRAARKLGLL